MKPGQPKASPAQKRSRRERARQLLQTHIRDRVATISWRDLAVTVGPFLLGIGLLLATLIWVLNPAPPHTLRLSSGPKGSIFYKNAEQYRKILARNGIDLQVVESEGSQENLSRLLDPKSRIDVGFVLDGTTPPQDTANLVSLGSVSHQPLFVFYRNDAEKHRLYEFKGSKLSVGRLGSGARALALALLKANGIEPGHETQLRALEADDAVDALLGGEIDGVFLMGDSARPEMIRKLLLAPGVRLFDFDQADAYTRRFAYLNKLRLPMGSVDLGQNIPAQDIALVAPTVELIARSALHPALSDLLIDAAREVHGRRTILQEAGEYPAAEATDFKLSDDAARYYKSGKGFFYRNLPFWLASLADRLLLALLPITVLLIPAVRILPWVYQWRIRSRIYRWYGTLLALERAALANPDAQDRATLLAKLDEVEAAVNWLKVPLAYVDQVYVLREHIGFVRSRLT